MKRNSIKDGRKAALTAFFCAFALFQLLATYSSADGLDWEMPVSHFDGVSDIGGYVSYWETVGEVNCGSGLKLPIFINFRSNDTATSPYLGQGWTLPLLESHMVQTGEKSFLMVQPDGTRSFFTRDTPTNTELKGVAGWKADIDGDLITVSGPGGLNLEFRNGHIISMTTSDHRKLEYVYAGPFATEIRENGKTLLKAEQNMGAGPVTALLFNDKRMAITLDQKPRVQHSDGQNFIGALDRSLKSLNPTEGTTKTFEFAVDDKIQPTLKITGNDGTEHLFTWNPASQRIISEDDWNYKIEPGREPNDYAALTRTNAQKQNEYWAINEVKGEETTISIDGVTTVLSWFTTGSLANRRRSSVSSKGGSVLRSEKWSYDESGHMYRDIVATTGKEILRTYVYDKDGKTERKFRNGTLVEVNLYGIDGLLKRGIYADGKIIDFSKVEGVVRPIKVAVNKAKNINLEQVLKAIQASGNGSLPDNYVQIKPLLTKQLSQVSPVKQ